MSLTQEQLQQAIIAAKEKLARIKADRLQASLKKTENLEASLGMQRAVAAFRAPTTKMFGSMVWNEEQQLAIDNCFFRRSFNLIGAAGTGKTTTLKACLMTLIENYKLAPLETGTKHLDAGSPGVALISYTRRAVRNIAKQMPAELKSHCITFHKLVEYQPEYYYDEAELDQITGEPARKMRFAPARNRFNPLPANLQLIVIDEASMLSTDFFNQLLEALPNPSQVQFIFLGDLNQLPPVYGIPILGKMLLQLPIVELTRVYRQALASPIISLALAVKDNNFDSFAKDAVSNWGAPASFTPKVLRDKVVLDAGEHGKVTLHPWKKTLDQEDATSAMHGQLRIWMKDGTYDPEQDLILCPWDKSFGAAELNLGIADYLAKSKEIPVWEVIAGYNKHYFAVGDKLLIDKNEAKILEIKRNPRYLGKTARKPSIHLNHWGVGTQDVSFMDDQLTPDQIDEMLEHAAEVDDRTREASHLLKVQFLDSELEEEITQSAIINNSSFAWCTTVHKAQGSECRRVFVITHKCHAAMCSRELIYTAFTRAAEELYVIMDPQLLAKAASKPRIKGDTLAEKLAFFNARLSEKLDE
jgi:ATP-dependent exoDNAse (exonuclease V) alpha subunit